MALGMIGVDRFVNLVFLVIVLGCLAAGLIGSRWPEPAVDALPDMKTLTPDGADQNGHHNGRRDTEQS